MSEIEFSLDDEVLSPDLFSDDNITINNSIIHLSSDECKVILYF